MLYTSPFPVIITSILVAALFAYAAGEAAKGE